VVFRFDNLPAGKAALAGFKMFSVEVAAPGVK